MNYEKSTRQIAESISYNALIFSTLHFTGYRSNRPKRAEPLPDMAA